MGRSGPFVASGASRFCLGVPGSHRGSVHASCTGAGSGWWARWVLMSSLRRGLPGAGASSRACGFGLCVLSAWLESRPVPSYVHRRPVGRGCAGCGVFADVERHLDATERRSPWGGVRRSAYAVSSSHDTLCLCGEGRIRTCAGVNPTEPEPGPRWATSGTSPDGAWRRVRRRMNTVPHSL
jgi:hypothetical protein